MHTIEQFRQGLQQHSVVGAPNAQNATDLASWLVSNGLRLYEDAFQQETGQRIPNLPDAKLIEQAYPKGMNEIGTKQAQQVFYAANARIFLKRCKIAAEAIEKAQPDPRRDVFASQHYSLLRNMALDAQVLLADWATSMQGVPAMYGIGKNTFHDSFQISHATEQLMFGGSPLFAFADLATDSATALLRVALETRIRFGLGLLAVRDLATGSVEPLNMSKILEAIKFHESKFKLAVPLQHIERIYGWSNIYVHVGLKSFAWSPIFALDYLKPLLRGGAYSGGSSVHSGIYIDKTTLLDIQAKAMTIIGLDATKKELMTIPPERCDVCLKL